MKHLKMLGLAAVAAMAMAAFAASSVSATAIEVEGQTWNESVAISASLASGTSAVLSRTDGSLANTCTVSDVKGDTESPFTGTTVTGAVDSLSFNSCTRAVTVHKAGTLHVAWIEGTTDGTVSSSGAEVTVGSPFGTLNCKTGSGVDLGRLTGTDGTPSVHAELHVNAVLNCGFLVPSATWKGTYTITSPTWLGVVKEGGGEEDGHPLLTTPRSMQFGTGSEEKRHFVLETKGPHFITSGPSFVTEKVFDTPWSGMSVESIACFVTTYGPPCTTKIISSASATGNGYLKIETTSGPKYIRIWHFP
ncbi:MAG: hypothetical protein M3Y75_03720 [Actinomycetota bacterium]|nr:hypothetical protein [Actinomycetota bacterium]